MTSLAGYHHTTLSVGDIERSLEWYGRVFGLTLIFRREDDTVRVAVMRLPGLRTTLGFVEHKAARPAEGFNPAQIGLDHLALRVESEEALAGWLARFDEEGVSHSGINAVPFGGILNFKDPDGIALALYWEREWGDGLLPDGPPAVPPDQL